MSKGYLALEDGRVFEGDIVLGELTTGEAVFNTSLTGYQEILSDPSYAGQIITMTYPHIGNYGAAFEDDESRGIFASGLVVKEFSQIHSNWRADISLKDYLEKNNIAVMQGVDTRALTKHIRSSGAMRSAIGAASKYSKESLVRTAKESRKMEGLDLASEVTVSKPYVEGDGGGEYYVVAVDFGMKRNITRMLVSLGCRVEVVPAKTSAAEILGKNSDGVFLSNGPGDPAAVGYAIDMIKELLGKVPVFGICLGHQLLSLALGAKTYKLKFGHRGANHPVKDLRTGKIEITSQNHGFAVDSVSTNIELTHINLNDNTVEGVACPGLKAFSVQYHPEAAPGPHDSQYLFHQFVELMESFKQGEGS